jgi:type I restriction enzyme, S subunit
MQHEKYYLEATNQGFINVVCDLNLVHNEYLAYWIKQNKKVFEGRAHGVTFREISRSSFKEIQIPLPPLAEQHRIVAKVDQLMVLCDKLEASLTAAAEIRRRLLDAVLHEALEPVAGGAED